MISSKLFSQAQIKQDLAHNIVLHECISEVLKKHNLLINVDKTEFTKPSRKEISWRDTRKVGTLIGHKEYIARRKQLSTAGIYKFKKNSELIKGDKLKRVTKVKLY